jgi:hypothetical protein
VGGEADGGKKRWESESEHECESGAVPEGTMTGLEGRVAGMVRWKQGKRRSSHDGEGRACLSFPSLPGQSHHFGGRQLDDSLIFTLSQISPFATLRNIKSLFFKKSEMLPVHVCRTRIGEIFEEGVARGHHMSENGVPLSASKRINCFRRRGEHNIA